MFQGWIFIVINKIMLFLLLQMSCVGFFDMEQNPGVMVSLQLSIALQASVRVFSVMGRLLHPKFYSQDFIQKRDTEARKKLSELASLIMRPVCFSRSYCQMAEQPQNMHLHLGARLLSMSVH